MSKKQREKVEDEVRYHRAQMVRSPSTHFSSPTPPPSSLGLFGGQNGHHQTNGGTVLNGVAQQNTQAMLNGQTQLQNGIHQLGVGNAHQMNGANGYTQTTAESSPDSSVLEQQPPQQPSSSSQHVSYSNISNGYVFIIISIFFKYFCSETLDTFFSLFFEIFPLLWTSSTPSQMLEYLKKA